MQRFAITKKEAGWRFDRYLKKLLPQATSGFLYKMLRKKNITLNKKKAAGNEVIAAGDIVELFFSKETFQKFSGKETTWREDGTTGSISNTEQERIYKNAYRKLGDIPVIYEDEDILILNKPAGILSQKAQKDDISLNEWVPGYLLQKKELPEEGTGQFRPSVCNRLDRNTSGLVLCGKSVRGSQFLSEMLRNQSLHKYYTACVQGRIEREIALNGYLKKEEEKNRSKILSEKEYRRLEPLAKKEYKKIETVVKPISYFAERDCTKLEILLVTGKSHQIRAHLSGIGHPVLGDRKYGWKPAKEKEEVWKYQLLHAGRVEFPKTEGEFAYLSGKCFRAPEPFWCYGI